MNRVIPKPGTLLALGALIGLFALEVSSRRQQAKTEAAIERLAEVVQASARRPGPDGGPRAMGAWTNLSGALTAEHLRAVIREELQGLLPPAHGSDDTTAPAAGARPVDSPARHAAFERAERVLADAVTARVWGKKQAAELADLEADLSQEHIASVMSRLLPAINKQQIQVETGGRLF